MESIEFVETKPLFIKERKIKIEKIPQNHLLLRPILAGICGSDLHYFLGHKDPEKLKKRLPLALLHEGIVEDLKSKKRYIINPMIVCQGCLACQKGEINYCQNLKFMASTAPGLSRGLFVYPKNLLYEIPEKVREDVATLVEPLSVAFEAIKRANIKIDDKIGVIGDGPIGFFLIVLLSFHQKIKKKNLFWFGRHDQKLNLAKDMATLINLKKEKNPESLKENFSLIFEAVGQKAQEVTINQALELVIPCGKIIILGITDLYIPIKTISIVNRGVSIIGASRSTYLEFQKVINLLKNPKLQKIFKKIINPKKFIIKTASDLQRALLFASQKEIKGKVLVKFDIPYKEK